MEYKPLRRYDSNWPSTICHWYTGLIVKGGSRTENDITTCNSVENTNDNHRGWRNCDVKWWQKIRKNRQLYSNGHQISVAVYTYLVSINTSSGECKSKTSRIEWKSQKSYALIGEGIENCIYFVRHGVYGYLCGICSGKRSYDNVLADWKRRNSCYWIKQSTNLLVYDLVL